MQDSVIIELKSTEGERSEVTDRWSNGGFSSLGFFQYCSDDFYLHVTPAL